jgi:hypothetical protein
MSKKKKQNTDKVTVQEVIGLAVAVAIVASICLFMYHGLFHGFGPKPDVRECIEKGHDYGSPIFETTSISELGAEEILCGNLVRLCKRCDYQKTECNTVWGRCGWSVTESARKEQKDGTTIYMNCIITDDTWP